MSNKLRRILSIAAGFALTASSLFSIPGPTADAAESNTSYSQTIEFEDQKLYEQNGRNRTDSSMFSGYTYISRLDGAKCSSLFLPTAPIRSPSFPMRTLTKKTGSTWMIPAPVLS